MEIYVIEKAYQKEATLYSLLVYKIIKFKPISSTALRIRL